MKYEVELHDIKPCYEGFFKIDAFHVSFERFSGGRIEQVIRECGKKHDIVAVLPFDPVRREFLMIEQFRIGMFVRGEHPWTMEIVAGFMDVKGEDEMTTAKRELHEETGCHAKALYPMTEYYPGPGGSAAKIKVFVAVVDSRERVAHTGLIEEGEDICVHVLSLEKMQQVVNAGELDNATSIIAFQQFFMYGWEEKLRSAMLGKPTSI